MYKPSCPIQIQRVAECVAICVTIIHIKLGINTLGKVWGTRQLDFCNPQTRLVRTVRAVRFPEKQPSRGLGVCVLCFWFPCVQLTDSEGANKFGGPPIFEEPKT